MEIRFKKLLIVCLFVFSIFYVLKIIGSILASYISLLGKNSDKVGIEAAEILLKNLKHGGAVDDSLQDQVRLLFVST